MFKYARESKVIWPVTIKTPRADGSGQVQNFTIKMTFKVMTRSDGMTLETADADEQDALLMRHIHGWEGVCDENGDELPFNEDNLRALLDLSHFRLAVSSAMREIVLGVAAKNS